MNPHSKSKTLLALVLAIAIAATGCSSQWINLALQDLPVLTQMALNITTLASTLASGQQASAADTAVIQNISAQASRDLNLLQSLYSEYKANPNGTTLQKIQNVISNLKQNVPALLESAHIGNPVLSARIAAAVSLILTTVNRFAALIPQPSPSASTAQKLYAGPAPGPERVKETVEPASVRPYRKLRTGRGVCAVDTAIRKTAVGHWLLACAPPPIASPALRRSCANERRGGIPDPGRRPTTNGGSRRLRDKSQEQKTMPLPVIAITNASTCLTDAQVEAVLPALQKQASDDFKAYWEQDCTLQFLPKSQPLPSRWWQIVITDNPDQAGPLGTTS